MPARRALAVAVLGSLLPLLAAATATTPAAQPDPAPAADEPVHEAAPPGLRRCVGPGGVAVFTDHSCASSDARPVTAPDAPPTTTAITRLRTCARSQDALLEGVRDALQERNPNRLAEFYHWSGMSTAEGYRMVERLERFSARPLMDVQLVSSRPATPPDRWRDRDYGFGYDDYGRWREPPREQAPAPSRAADLLRVDQMRAEDDYDAEVTYFHLRSNAGCWWLQF